MHPPAPGRLFEDLVDGYFPLGESLRQTLARNGLEAALVLITQAPVLHLPQSAGPVPLRLPRGASGLIRRFWGYAWQKGAEVQLIGAGDWHWDDGSTHALNAATRLAEPAFLRGIGQIAGKRPAQGRFWGFRTAPDGIRPLAQFGRANLCFGTDRAATGPGLWLDLSDAATRARAARIAAEFGP